MPGKPPAPPSPPVIQEEEGERSAVSRYMGLILGASVLIVVAFFLITALSKKQAASPEAATEQSATPSDSEQPTAELSDTAIEQHLPPLPAPLAEQAATIKADIEALQGNAKITKQRELVELLTNARRPYRAALEQKKIAEALNTPAEWRHTGDLWMQSMERLGQGAELARQVIEAYQHVLAAEPDNVDVRTDMATAYLSTNNPMQAVEEVKRVLETDSTHVQARLNYGVMLALIGRNEQAVEQFEQVKTYADPESPFYLQAEQAIRSLQTNTDQ
ncbi:MAG: tetratricopeptide repeat protein [Rhodothermales bacterium]